jgi:hypothetical protein
MQITLNRQTLTGLSIALLTALTALLGAPRGFEEFRIPIWELLLQFNLCTGFVFLILGVLESVETPVPDFRPAMQLFAAAFVAYGMVCVFHAASLAVPFHIQLFLFTTSLACLGAGWARFGLSVLRQLDVKD